MTYGLLIMTIKKVLTAHVPERHNGSAASRSARAQLDPAKRLWDALVDVVHDPGPRAARRVVDESVLEGDFAVPVLEHERQRLALLLRVAGAFGGERAAGGVVEPKDGVLAPRRVPGDVHDRLVGGLPPRVLLARHLVEANVEMVQYPLPVDVVRRVLAGDPALENPMPDQAAEPRIVSGGRLGADGRGGDAAHDSQQHESFHIVDLAEIIHSCPATQDDRCFSLVYPTALLVLGPYIFLHTQNTAS